MPLQGQKWTLNWVEQARSPAFKLGADLVASIVTMVSEGETLPSPPKGLTAPITREKYLQALREEFDELQALCTQYEELFPKVLSTRRSESDVAKFRLEEEIQPAIAELAEKMQERAVWAVTTAQREFTSPVRTPPLA